MVRPSRPDPGLRRALRRSERVRRGSRRVPTAPTGAPLSTAGLTTRAAVLGLVLCALVVSAALPLREFLSQRARIAQVEQEQADQRVRVRALEDQRRLLDDPAYVASLARERLHFVRPGETAYVVIGAEGVREPEASGGQ